MPYETPRVNLYRNISISFVVFTVLLLISVFFLFYNHATITLVASEQKINLNFNAEVRPDASVQEVAERDILSGKFMTIAKSATSTFSVLSTKALENSTIVGRVKIVNNYSKNQVLAKTTQLQAENGVIVRTNEPVNVPAGGSVDVDVYAKDPATFQEIVPGNLVIVKLSPSLQDKIYGTASANISNNPTEVKVLGESDINRAKEELLARLSLEVKKELNINENNEVTTEVVKWSANKKVGDQTDSFELQLTARVKYLDIDTAQLDKLLDRKIAGLNLAGMSTLQVDRSAVSYAITDSSFGDGALIKVNYVLGVKLNESSSILDKEAVAGKSISEAKQYLSQLDGVSQVAIEVSPYWKKILPKQTSKIDIIVK